MSELSAEQKNAIKEQVSQFESALQSSSSVTLEDHLRQSPRILQQEPAQSRLFQELLAAEVSHLRENGFSLGAAEYEIRFPDRIVELRDVLSAHAESTDAHSGDTRIISPGAELRDLNRLKLSEANEYLSNRRPPLSLGDYELISKIGQGGMGQVFKARHRHTSNSPINKTTPVQ